MNHKVTTSHGGVDKPQGEIILGANTIGAVGWVTSRAVEEISHGDDSLIPQAKIASTELVEASLHSIGDSRQQVRKIKTFLHLARQHTESAELQKKYFNSATELARRYLGEDYQNAIIQAKQYLREDNEGATTLKSKMPAKDMSITGNYIEDLVSTYIKYISSHDNLASIPKNLYPDIYEVILHRQLKEKEKVLKEIREGQHYIGDDDSPEQILRKLEDITGPVRLCVISRNSKEIMNLHNIEESEAQAIQASSKNIRHTRVSPFHKSREYSIIIDYGSSEASNQMPEELWKGVIKKILDVYIIRMEGLFSEKQHDAISALKILESRLELPKGTNNYRNFIINAIALMDPRESYGYQDNPGYIDDVVRAIDICRIMTLYHSDNIYIHSSHLLEHLHQILGGRIRRRVLNIVKMMLISRDETMNGLGYPYGLNKNNIPFEARIYSIIRNYESLGRNTDKDRDEDEYRAKTKSILQQGGLSGYFDKDILKVFFESLEMGAITKNPPQIPPQKEISPYQQSLYEPYIELWEYIMNKVEQIEGYYLQFRDARTTTGKQSAISIDIGKAREELTRKVDIRIIVTITLHGETASDLKKGQPGVDDEVLAMEGIESTHRKGEKLKGLSIVRMYSSPILRCTDTSRRLCREVRECVHSCMDCSSVTIEPSLKNPPKHRDDGRMDDGGKSYILKFLVDDPVSLARFMREITRSPTEGMSLIVTHGTTAEYLNLISENLGLPDKISSEKVHTDHEMMHVLLFRGGLMSKWQLFFSVDEWKNTLSNIVTITESVFTDAFRPSHPGAVNLIHLHDEFLDYLDYQRETQPQMMSEFIHRLEIGEYTRHIPAILESDWRLQKE